MGLPKDWREGVLFLTYSTLVSKTNKCSRLDQIIEWFGGDAADGCILLDECHKVGGCLVLVQRLYFWFGFTGARLIHGSGERRLLSTCFRLIE